MAEVSVTVELTESVDPDGAISRIQMALKNAFGLRIPVSVADQGLPRFEFKARRWVTEP